MTNAYIGLGSNLDGPIPRVRAALGALDGIASTRLVRASGLYASAPVGYADQPDFVNAVAHVETRLTARELLEALLALEVAQGRRRDFPNAPRTLDLDLLVYGDEVVHEHGLTVPHPRMAERAFVLVPLAEIAPRLRIPGMGTVAGLLAGVAGQRVEAVEPAEADRATAGAAGRRP